MPAAFACLVNEERKGRAEMSTCQVIVGPQTMFTGGTACVRRDNVTDGTASTILVVETNDLAPWTAPHDVAFSSASSPGACGSGHPGGLDAAMADRSVRFIKSTIDPGVHFRERALLFPSLVVGVRGDGPISFECTSEACPSLTPRSRHSTGTLVPF
jgi:hypothetical protein